MKSMAHAKSTIPKAMNQDVPTTSPQKTVLEWRSKMDRAAMEQDAGCGWRPKADDAGKYQNPSWPIMAVCALRERTKADQAEKKKVQSEPIGKERDPAWRVRAVCAEKEKSSAFERRPKAVGAQKNKNPASMKSER